MELTANLTSRTADTRTGMREISHRTIGFLGYAQPIDGTWRATVHRSARRLGSFPTLHDAALALDNAREFGDEL